MRKFSLACKEYFGFGLIRMSIIALAVGSLIPLLPTIFKLILIAFN